MKTKGGIIEAAMKYRQIVILIVSLMFFLGILVGCLILDVYSV